MGTEGSVLCSVDSWTSSQSSNVSCIYQQLPEPSRSFHTLLDVGQRSALHPSCPLSDVGEAECGMKTASYSQGKEQGCPQRKEGSKQFATETLRREPQNGLELCKHGAKEHCYLRK